MKIGVVGASGYAGGELLRLLAGHPNFKVTYISAGSNAGELISSIHPHLSNYKDIRFEATEISQINKCDLVFIALPHGESAKLIEGINESIKVVDLGADYRLSDPEKWSKYYGGSYAGKWQYGLPEIVGEEVFTGLKRVANPGCYATAISLSLAPALDVIKADDIVVVAASGTTGAGRSAKINLLASEVMGSLTSYKFGGVHQHTPEVEECLNGFTDENVNISFTPILAPMPRGILATSTALLIENIDTDEIRNRYKKYYENSTFVTILENGHMPMTASVLGTNNVQIQVAVDAHTNRLVISCAIDNLGKGAAGQAIQNANLICGLPMDTGLQLLGVR
jgi:N-acetyl-gamma-glutamyl-phosphate reductase